MLVHFELVDLAQLGSEADRRPAQAEFHFGHIVTCRSHQQTRKQRVKPEIQWD